MANITKIENKAAWEMIGKSVDTDKIAVALEKVGLNFQVEKRPVSFQTTEGWKKIADKFATVRTDLEKDLGIVGKGYVVLPNETAFSFADYIGGGIKFSHGGMCYTGLCYVIGELPSIKICGEDYTPCVVLQNSFNGKYCLRASIVAKHNATGSLMNLDNGISSTIKIKHSINLPNRMKQGQEALVQVGEYMNALAKKAEKMANLKMSKAQMEMMIDLLFPIRPSMSETVKANVTAQRKMFLACYDTDGNAAHKGSAWGIIKAYADYTSHTITKDTKTKYERKFMETALGKKGSFGSFLKKLETVTGNKIA